MSKDRSVEKNYGLIIYAVEPLFKMRHLMPLEDIIHEGIIAYLESVDDYDHSRSSFSNFMVRRIRGYLLNKLSQLNRVYSVECELTDDIFNKASSNGNMDKIVNKMDIERHLSLLSLRSRDILIKRYHHELTQKEVGAIHNITQQRVYQLEIQALKKLKDALSP